MGARARGVRLVCSVVSRHQQRKALEQAGHQEPGPAEEGSPSRPHQEILRRGAAEASLDPRLRHR